MMTHMHHVHRLLLHLWLLLAMYMRFTNLPPIPIYQLSATYTKFPNLLLRLFWRPDREDMKRIPDAYVDWISYGRNSPNASGRAAWCRESML
jgi:hypothetical protein